MMKIEKYTFGVGDRFAHQAKAQLQAFEMAAERGIEITPVWNKSNREHLIIGTEPSSVRAAAVAAVAETGWTKPWHVDADHINLDTVDRFLTPSDFYTLDVAHFIGRPAAQAELDAFVAAHPELIGVITVPGIAEPFTTTPQSVAAIAAKYLVAVREAGRIYQYIASKKGVENFITEVSMDETDAPQTPPELLVILAAIADEKIPIQTIAPKFTGRFNKGVDYVGDVAQFTQEFSDDLAVIAYAIAQYGLPETLKLSVHSGSDKFSIYQPIREALRRTGAGLHIKTAGTTWLEELIGLAEAGPAGLALAKEVYSDAYDHKEELCEPYASVIDIDYAKLPLPAEVNAWTPEQYTGALRHVQANPAFNLHVRQLLHVGYKVAAKMGDRYLNMLRESEASIARNVTENIFDRHVKPLFLD
ncbi:MAG TPA: tagaturonate epimerase family protein [Bryobacteraceae bacterium]|nr:tagaturonate epimerase family protein [Bryobacteraceae bacterium]